MRATGPCQPPARGEDDASAFGGGDALCGGAEAGVGAEAYFDEYQRVALQTNQIDLTAAAVDVAGDEFHALFDEPTGGVIFRELTARLRRMCGRIHNRGLRRLPFFFCDPAHEQTCRLAIV